MRCPNCGQDVPAGNYCVRCGARLGEAGEPGPGGRGHFAAAPHERLNAPRLVSTLLPHLPRSDMAPFRIVLIVGAATVGALGGFGLFPVALVAAAVLAPLVMLLYLLHVDLYEDEPVVVLAATMVWGAVAGVALGLANKAIAPTDVGLLLTGTPSRVLARGVMIPIAGLLLALAGPLVLLRHRKFNDVLDGVTFGAISAVFVAAAQTLVEGGALLRQGLRPVGSAGPWIFRLLSQGVLIPILWASAGGIAGAALWLRFRAPVRDRDALGPAGKPTVAIPLAAVLVVGGAILLLELGPVWSFFALVPVDLVAVILLRRAIHLGLLEESREAPIGPDITCPNCGHSTPRHTFCIDCGISLAALPKGRASRQRPAMPAPATPQAEPGREDD